MNYDVFHTVKDQLVKDAYKSYRSMAQAEEDSKKIKNRFRDPNLDHLKKEYPSCSFTFDGSILNVNSSDYSISVNIEFIPYILYRNQRMPKSSKPGKGYNEGFVQQRSVQLQRSLKQLIEECNKIGFNQMLKSIKKQVKLDSKERYWYYVENMNSFEIKASELLYLMESMETYIKNRISN